MAADKVLVKDGRKLFRCFMLAVSVLVLAAAAFHTAQGADTAQRELIPGAEQLSDAERDAYRRRMESAATEEQKAGIRAEYARAAQGKAAVPTLVGDPKRGAELHSACFGCHGIERYTRPMTHALATFYDSVLRASGFSDLPPQEPKRFKGRIESLEALRAAVERRNELFNPKMTPQEVEDVVAYLNVTYYRFPQRMAESER